MSMLWLPGGQRRGISGALTGPCGSAYTPVMAASFANATAYLESSANSDLNASANTSILVCGWVWLNALTDNQFVCGKYDNSNVSLSEWRLIWASGAARFAFTRVSSLDAAASATSAVGASAGQWNFVWGRYDGNVAINCGFNATAEGTNAVAGTTATSRSKFRVGRTASNDMQLAGKVDALGIWFGNAVNYATIISSVYKAGAGKAYADLSAADKTGLSSWYEMNEDNGVSSYCDWHGSVHLAPTNMAQIAGKV